MKSTVERQQLILDRLEKENRVFVSDLGTEFDVSDVTIRKDLKELESQGLLQRVHGGATTISKTKASVESTLRELSQHSITEKQAIAREAYAFINDGDAILMDASSTTYELAVLIKNGSLKNLTVITTSLYLAMELVSCEHVQVIQIGGIVRSSLVTTMGPMATDCLKSIHTDKVFIGVNGVDVKAGLTTQNIFECEIKHHMLKATTHAFVLADSSKMRRIALGVIGPLSLVDYIITDNRVAPSFISDISKQGVDVVVAHP